MDRRWLFILFTLACTGLQGQIFEPVTWSFSNRMISPTEAELIFRAEIEDKWHLYSQDIPMTPPATTFTFEDVKGYELVGKVTEPAAIEEYDPNFKMVLKYFAREATFTQKIRLLGQDTVTVKGYINFMSCDDEKCLPPADEEFNFTFHQQPVTGKTTADSVQTVPPSRLAPLPVSGIICRGTQCSGWMKSMAVPRYSGIMSD